MNIEVNIYPASTGQTGTFSLATIDELRAGTGGNKAIPTDVLGQYLGELGYPVPVPTRLPLPDGIALGDLAIGEEISIILHTNAWTATPWTFVVIHKGSPGTLYHGIEGGVIVMMKNLFSTRAWRTGNNNQYEGSPINLWLNNEFYNLIDPDISSQIMQVRIPYCPDRSKPSEIVVASGINGLLTKVFLLSAHEVDIRAQFAPAEGTTLAYFAGMEYEKNNARRVARLSNNSTEQWWLRTPYSSSSSNVWLINKSGNSNQAASYNSNGIRPCLVLPATYRIFI